MDYASARLQPHELTRLLLQKVRFYVTLAKPGIIFGNALTMTAGFALATRGIYPWLLFLATLCGLSLIIASAGAFNNYFDRSIDARMERTKMRPLANGSISVRSALSFGTCCGLMGFAMLYVWVNAFSALLAASGWFIYLFAYGFSKYYTTQGTLIGSVAGAIPAAVGYSANIDSIDTSMVVLFCCVVCWQMPHFHAISIYRIEDYRIADIPILPITTSIRTTQMHMIAYSVAFIACCMLLALSSSLGLAFISLTAILGTLWLAMSMYGLLIADDHLSAWARSVFLFSLVVILGLCAAIHVDLLFASTYLN